MASESSSAVLELNDDTEPPSISEDMQDAVPLIMETGYDIAVKVDAPMKQLSTLETFVTYRVRCVCARWPTPPAVRRRYNHFKVLHKRLSASQSWVAPPALPPLHTARQQLDRYSPSFVAVRTMALQAFLERVAKHPIFTHNEDFRLFLTVADDEFDKVFKSENSALNLWGLSAALYGSADNKPTNNGARVKDPEWTSYLEYLSSLQHKLTTLCTLTTKLNKGRAALTEENMNMKRVCDAWCTQAGGATSRAVGAVSAGCAPRPPPAAHSHRAVLPLLAAYTAAHAQSIKNRGIMHAAYVSGADTSGEMHNKLEQCTEALRSELSDWMPKTRTDIKKILLELADSQVSLHSQLYYSWERALKLSQDANVEEMFKTVSKTAVQNLSPSKCRLMTPTLTDLDDLDSNEGSDREFGRSEIGGEGSEVDERSEVGEQGSEVGDREFVGGGKSDIVGGEVSEVGVQESEVDGHKSEFNKQKSEVNDRKHEVVEQNKVLEQESGVDEWREVDLQKNQVNEQKGEVNERCEVNEQKSEDNKQRRGDSNEQASENSETNDKLSEMSENSDWVEVNSKKDTSDSFVKVSSQEKSEVLDESCSKDAKDSSSLEESSKSEVGLDPLMAFLGLS